VGYDALMSGDDHEVWPRRSKLLAVLAKFAPDRMAVYRLE
jgi:hypothetical protein